MRKIKFNRNHVAIGLTCLGSIGVIATKEYIDVVTSDAIVKDGKVYVVMDFLSRPEYGYDDLY